MECDFLQYVSGVLVTTLYCPITASLKFTAVVISIEIVNSLLRYVIRR